MIKSIFILLPVLILSPAVSSAQHSPLSQDTVIAYEMSDTLFTVGQESIPPNDSGGRWVKTNILITSTSAFPVHVFGFPIHDFYSNIGPENGCAPSFACKPDDSAWLIADSLMASETENGEYVKLVSFGPASKYKDSISALPYPYAYRNEMLDFVVPPHGTLRVPYLFQLIGSYSVTHAPEDISGMFFPMPPFSFGTRLFSNGPLWYSDSVVGNKVLRRIPLYTSDNPPSIYEFAPSSAPYTPSFKGTWTNKDNPVVSGRYPPWFVEFQDTLPAFEDTKVSFKIVGEFADHFVPPPDTLILRSCIIASLPAISSTFNGAPKSICHDTLVASWTDSLGTIITRNPIEAYTIFPDGYTIRQLSPNLTAPFLGSTQGNVAVVVNTSNFPLSLRNVHASSYNGDSIDFEVSAPAIIAPLDSAYITVTLKDKNVYRDTISNQRSTDITGIIGPYQQDFNFVDSIFSFAVTGNIDVYCPRSFSLAPKLKSGIHPTGIIFTSSVSSNLGPHSFLTIYGNDDSTTEYFGVPYYDDPHFQLETGNYVGLGSVPLPGYVEPDSTYLSPVIQVKTTFTGDNYHNYQTQLHWPRSIDTVTIDVVCLGSNATPFEHVASEKSHSIWMWPNPALDMVRVANLPEPTDVLITDQLGRRMTRQKLEQSDIIDVSHFAPGMYEFYFPALGRSTKIQILR